MILYIKFQTDNLVENFIIESENYELENLLEEEAKEKIIDILYKEITIDEKIKLENLSRIIVLGREEKIWRLLERE